MTAKKKQIALLLEPLERPNYYGTFEFASSKYGAREARAKEGWTSVRLDKATYARLQAISAKLPQLLRGPEGIADRYYYTRALPMVELLELLSRSTPCMLPDPGSAAAVHASVDPEKHASTSRKKHASPAAAKRRRSA